MNALTLITECATLFGDEQFTRITRENWRVFLNSVSRDVCARFRVQEYTATANVVANQAEYIYPSDMIQIRFIRYTDGASDPWDLDEMPMDDWRRRTNRMDQSNVPDAYVPGQSALVLVPKPATSVAAGLILRYWGLAPDVSNITNEGIQLPDFFAEYLKMGMMVQAKRKDKEFDEANSLYATWRQQDSETRSAMEDRARDRRPSLRPKNVHQPTRGQV